MIKNTLQHVQRITVPKITDVRGNLSVIEKNTIPFSVQRVYYLYDVPSGSHRGGHAHKSLIQFLIAVSGSFNVVLHDGLEQRTITLNRPDEGLMIPTGIWRELDNFSSGSVCLVLASEVFDEDDYIRDFDRFLALKSR